eukprot:5775139-Prymnesium_polylepis.3
METLRILAVRDEEKKRDADAEAAAAKKKVRVSAESTPELTNCNELQEKLEVLCAYREEVARKRRLSLAHLETLSR